MEPWSVTLKFKNFSQLAIFLGIKIGFFFYLYHTFHHRHGKSAILVSNSIDVNFKFLLDSMQLNPKFSNNVSIFSFFELEIFFYIDLILKTVFINFSKFWIFLLLALIMETHEFDFVFINFFKWLNIDLKFLSNF